MNKLLSIILLLQLFLWFFAALISADWSVLGAKPQGGGCCFEDKSSIPFLKVSTCYDKEVPLNKDCHIALTIVDFCGDYHLLLASLSGKSPGIPLGPCTLPLNMDNYTFLAINDPETYLPFGHFFGPSKDSAETYYWIIKKDQLPKFLGGTEMSFCFLTFGPNFGLNGVSNGETIKFVYEVE